MYSPQILDHFEHPRNAGSLDSADAIAQVENPVCGDVLKLSAKLSQGRIAEVKFLAKGCVPTMACGSAVTELLRGKTPAEARTIKGEEIVSGLGGLPEASSHASQLAMDAVAALLEKLRNTEQ